MTALSPDDEMSSAELAPRRMLEGGGSEHERSLLASARLDRVPSDAKARVAAALGGVLEPPLLEPEPCEPEPCKPERAAPGDALSRLGARSGLYILGAGVVGAIAIALWLRATPGESTTVGSTLGVASAPPPGAAVPGADTPAREARAEPAQHAASTPLDKPTVQAASSAQARRAEQQVPSPVARSAPQRPKPEGDRTRGEPLDSGLLAEVRALEAVSAAISAGQTDRAARELDAYRRRFARGELAVEAEVLAIQVATLGGDPEAASARAERLLARPEAQHYRARVSALLEGNVRRAGSTNRENAERGGSNDAAAHMRARR